MFLLIDGHGSIVSWGKKTTTNKKMVSHSPKSKKIS